MFRKPRLVKEEPMLVLGRRIGESVTIGNGIVVRILGVRGGQVRVGVEAPASVQVRRPDSKSGARQAVETTNAPAAPCPE
jgi:carbon storage regulator